LERHQTRTRNNNAKTNDMKNTMLSISKQHFSSSSSSFFKSLT